MFGRNLEDFIKVTEEPRSFDEDFFDFTDRIYPWTTVYRFFFLADFERGTQFMLGAGQKNLRRYHVNGEPIEFTNNEPDYRMGVSYWLENGSLLHRTVNDDVNVENGLRGDSFSFIRENGGYTLEVPDVDIKAVLDDKSSKTDYIRFNAGISPFYRHNKYLPFKGRVMGRRVEKGVAFIQKVYLNMPFMPWRWGRVFFESGARFDFYEPRFVRPLYRSINFEHNGKRLEFKQRQQISFDDSLWNIAGRAATGEKLSISIRPYQSVRQTFETPRTIFDYTEMPSRLESFEITKNGETLFSQESLGESVANCEEAFYSKLLI
ncbi:hypothetical protein BMS3Abin16_00568 [archaeon BMS3Abin16]|nr:hypothetical protein BMS3Abin16_00568 [archaeon BMS3Abin16]